jgi:hypothetical protein
MPSQPLISQIQLLATSEKQERLITLTARLIAKILDQKTLPSPEGGKIDEP